MKMILELTRSEAEEAASWLGRSSPKTPEVLSLLRQHLTSASQTRAEVSVLVVELWLAGKEEKS